MHTVFTFADVAVTHRYCIDLFCNTIRNAILFYMYNHTLIVTVNQSYVLFTAAGHQFGINLRRRVNVSL